MKEESKYKKHTHSELLELVSELEDALVDQQQTIVQLESENSLMITEKRIREKMGSR